MKLLINPSGGIAGDMFSAALIHSGVPENKMIDAMLLAASKIGKARISTSQSDDGATKLDIQLSANNDHLPASKAKDLLVTIFNDLQIKPEYKKWGNQILNILIAAEKKAHADNNFPIDHVHKHHHHEHNQYDHEHHHQHEDAFLHEAQDILIDISGAVTGLQELNAEPQAILEQPVTVGGGTVIFSHGELPVPAPATRIILEKYAISWQHGSIKSELCTPTGAAILAALQAKLHSIEGTIIGSGKARGTKLLDIPPLIVSLYK